MENLQNYLIFIKKLTAENEQAISVEEITNKKYKPKRFLK